MANRPTVGGSDGTWGAELNAHLDVSLATDGKVDDGAEQTSSAAPTANAELSNKKYVDDEITTVTTYVDNKHIAGAIAISQLATGGVQMKTGTYTGNSAATKAITGVGFQPNIVFALNNANNVRAFLKTDTMGLNTAGLWLNGWYSTDLIISLDADGFTVGDGTPLGNQLNANGVVYSYIAIGINS